MPTLSVYSESKLETRFGVERFESMLLRLCVGFYLSFLLFSIVECELLEKVSYFRSARHAIWNDATRVKRDANVTHLDDPKGCLGTCNNALLDKLWRQTQENHTTSADTNCKAQLEAFECFDSCPQSQLKALLNSSREITLLMCTDAGKKYVASYSCLQKVLPPANTSCDGTCKEYGNSSVGVLTSIHYYDFGTISYQTDGSLVAKALTDVCKLFQCKATCTVPAISGKCGKEIAETSSKVTRATLNQCINSYRSLGVLHDEPAECKAIL